MPGLSRFDFYPRDWFLDTRDLSERAKACYIDLLVAMYANGGPLKHDEKYLCRLCGYKQARRLRTALNELIDSDKIKLVAGRLVNNRAMEEIAAANQRIENAKKGGRAPKSSKNASKTDRKRSEKEVSFEGNQTLSLNTPSPSPSKKERKHAARYVFAGKVIKLNAEDLSTWRRAYSAIPDIEAALQGLDDFYGKEPPEKQRVWFIRASRALDKQHQEYLAKNPKAKRRRNVPDVCDVPDEPLWPPKEVRQ